MPLKLFASRFLHIDRLVSERHEWRPKRAAPVSPLEARDQAGVRRHFVDSYETYVRGLIASHPLDEAMALAVGGDYDFVGAAEVDVLRVCGIQETSSVVDIGCGSGRLAKHLGLNFPGIEYLGTDVVQELLDYAAKQSPRHFRFVRHHDLSIPAPDGWADFVTAFSVFTHLFHEESYVYLRDAKRVLKPDGSIVFSFLESARNWPIFEGMLRDVEAPHRDHLNMFIERSQIEIWAAHLGLQIMGFDFGPDHDGYAQTVTVLRNKA